MMAAGPRLGSGDHSMQDHPYGHLGVSIWYMDYPWYMSMKRTNVYADPEDLAIIKEAAKRRGISEAEIIRQGIHLAAMANRVWDEPLFSRTFEGTGRTPSKPEVRDVVADAVRRETGPDSGSAA
ncbi:hypothetical protein SSRG_03041 [Streptomyces griseoflavus Tu4000]|uniref:Ribbon-helix-helix protein CopG domain-containing protein n=2 Tax=Streptomyces TaxID=1883 RepID=D9XL41_9ACTN|nr:hypothetical protein SSRG_03041 [Streptomyces griseoflavus Tu4000]